MAYFDIQLPKASTPSPGGVPKIPLGSVGEQGMMGFGQAVQNAAHTAVSAINLLNRYEREQLQQQAYTESMKALMELENRDLTKQDEYQAEVMSDTKMIPQFAKDHTKYIDDQIKELGRDIPKDMYAQRHWLEAAGGYLRKRRGELRMLQANMLVSDFETTTKAMLSSHEAKLAGAESVAELNAIEDTETLRHFDQSQEAAIKNRITTRSKYDENRLNVLGNFQRIRYNRMLELDPHVAGVQFRQNGMARTEDILRAIPDPDTSQMDAAGIEKSREARKARIAMVTKSFIWGGHANQQTVLALNEQLKFDSKTFDDLMQTATNQANNVHLSQERRYQEEKRQADAKYNEVTTNLWGKLFSRKLNITDLEAAEKANVFAQHPDTYHSLHQALKSLHQEDQGVNADASLPEFLSMKLKIQGNASSPDVQPEKWINSKMSLGQKSELYDTLRLWQDKLQKDPRLHTDEFNAAKDHLETITGGKTASYNGKPESLRMLKLQGQVLHTFALDVAGGMDVNKAFKKGREYVEAHNKALDKPVLRQIPPGYVPPTNEQIEKQYPNPNDPRRYDAIEERERYEEILHQQEIEKQNKDSQAEASKELESFWSRYNPFR